MQLATNHTAWDSSRRAILAALVSLAMLGLCAYYNSFSGAFNYDDGLCLTGDHVIDQWFPAQPAKYTTGRSRWFTHLTFVANYKLHGFHVAGYHAVNLAIHIAGSWLLFALVRRVLLLEPTRERYQHSAFWIALAVAALWLVHPLQTESVTYIVQRLESLAGMFILLLLYALLRGSQSRYAWLWYALALAALWLGCASKEYVLVAPLVAVAFDRIYLATSWREVWQRRKWFYAGMLPTFFWTSRFLIRLTHESGREQIGFGSTEHTAWEYLRSQPAVLLHYLRLCFWPDQQCLDYYWPVENDPLRIYGLGAIIVALLAITVYALWKQPRWGFLGLAFFVILSPTSSFMPIRDLAFEHRMYLPLASVVILTVLALEALCRHCFREPIPRVAVPSVLVLLASFGLVLATWQRNEMYQDPVAVWQDILVTAPHSSRAHYNLGQALANRGSVTKGREHYRYLLQHNVKGLESGTRRAASLPFNEDIQQAIASYQAALVIDPKEPSTNFNIAGIYDRAGFPDQAIPYYRAELVNTPRHLHARLNLAALLAKRGETEAALEQYRIAHDKTPQDPRPLSYVGKLLLQQGKPDAALEVLQQNRQKHPEHVVTRVQLARVQWELGNQSEAIALLRGVRQRDRSLTDVNLLLAKYLATTDSLELHQPAEAAALAQGVIDNAGAENLEAWSVLASCLAELKRYDDAVIKLDRAIELAQQSQDEAQLATLRAQREVWRALIDSPHEETSNKRS